MNPFRARALNFPWRSFLAGGVGLATVAVTLAVMPGSAAEDPLADSDKILQSVDVTMSPDGTLTAVNSAVVATSDDEEDATTSSEEHSPEDVRSELPVRVLTAYRTEDGTGTDLADLDGHSGRVEIDLTIENLTVKPTTLDYDVAGTRRTESALVGAPLTIVASTSLAGVDPSTVVTKGTKTEVVTNGVLSQSDKGDTQVQWATILAPPQLDSSTTLTLVVDADNFETPDFDLSVQPGLVTDPSIGALVDAAFNPAASSELRLQQRTIDLIGDVNEVLGKASGTIATVRKTLDSSAETLGTKTVEDLKSSTKGVASSMTSLGGTVTSLGEELSSTLQQTNSGALVQMQETVASVEQLLGNTQAPVPPAPVRGRGCEARVPAPRKSENVYGNLLRVVSQLDGYAKTTAGCKATVQKAILDSVGPAQPSATVCVESSVTCSLFGTEARFNRIAQRLQNDGESAVAALDPQVMEDAVTAQSDLSTAVDAVSDSTDALFAAFESSAEDIEAVEDTLGGAQDALNAFSGELQVMRNDANAQAAEAFAMLNQNNMLAFEICGLAGDGPNQLSPVQVERLRSYIVENSCVVDGASTPINPPGGFSKSMNERIEDQQAAWLDIAARTRTGPSAGTIGLVVTQFQEIINLLADQLEAVSDGLPDADSSDIATSVAALKTARTTLDTKMQAVRAQQVAATDSIRAAFAKAATDTSREISTSVKEEIRRVTRKSVADSTALGAMFDKSVSGLGSAAATIRRNGAQTVDKQKRSLARSQRVAERNSSSRTRAGLATISQGVSSSTRDMDAASALLQRDLAKVLLDLGERRVRGSGLLGSMMTSAATAGSADFQLAQAVDQTEAYAGVRSTAITGILLRQAQTEAALRSQADLPAFVLDLPFGAEHRTVYSYHLRGDR